jgi:hypothetical protein
MPNIGFILNIELDFGWDNIKLPHFESESIHFMVVSAGYMIPCFMIRHLVGTKVQNFLGALFITASWQKHTM